MQRLIQHIALLGLIVASTSCVLAQETQADSTRAMDWVNMAASFAKNGQKDSAHTYFQKGADLFKQAENWRRYCICQNQRANLFLRDHQWDVSNELLKERIPICLQKLGRIHSVIRDAYTIRAINTISLGKLNEAKDLFLSALHISENLPGPKNTRLAGSYGNMASLYSKLGDFDSADYYYEAEINTLEEIEAYSHPFFSATYHNLAISLMNRRRYQEALQHLEKALHIALEHHSDDHKKLVKLYNDLAICHARMGDSGHGKLWLNKGLEIIHNNPESLRQEAMYTHTNLGNFFTKNKEWDQAIHHLQQSITFSHQLYGRQHLHSAFNQSKLGDLFEAKGLIRQALVEQQEAASILSNIEDTVNLESSEILFNLAFSYLHNHEIDKSLKAGHRSLSILKQYVRAPFHPHITVGILKLNQIYLEAGKDRAVLQLCQDGYRGIFPDYVPENMYSIPLQCLEQPHRTWELLLQQSQAIESLAKKGKTSLLPALDIALKSVQAINQSQNRHLSSPARQQAQENIHRVYTHSIHLLFELYQQDSDPVFAQQAFIFSDQSKSRFLRASLREDQATRFAGIPDSILSQENQLNAEIRFYEKSIFEEKNGAQADTSKIRRWAYKLNQLQEASRTLILELEEKYPDYYRLKYDNFSPTIEQIREGLPDYQTSLVQYFQGKHHLYLFELRKDGLRFKRLDWTAQEETQLQSFLASIQYRDRIEAQGNNPAYLRSFASQSHHWFQELLAPVFTESSERMIVVSDGILGYLPFEILISQHPAPNPASYEEIPFLLQKVSISYAFNAALLVEPYSSQNRASEDYLGFAPSYPPSYLTDSSGNTSAYVAQHRANFGPLRHNQEEIMACSELWNGKVVLGKDAKKDLFIHEANNYRILHLAMHAFIHDLHPLFHGLVFSGATASVLEAHELYSMHLSADLAILSGCKTGLGEWKKGEGIMSMARAFRYAGCPSITMSLWSADDESTATIMQAYLHNLKQGKPKDQALQLAKIDYLNSQPNNHPYFWAAFVQTGDYQPLQKRNKDFYVWGLLFISCIGLGILLYRTRLKIQIE
ncbi:MAG: CHAT domain-containing tetratricopeptide repeat protein [Bacteroidota bacterium]